MFFVRVLLGYKSLCCKTRNESFVQRPFSYVHFSEGATILVLNAC